VLKGGFHGVSVKIASFCTFSGGVRRKPKKTDFGYLLNFGNKLNQDQNRTTCVGPIGDF
jgi:hypothetical protein